MVYERKKEKLRRQLALRLSKLLNRRVDLTEIMDRAEASERAGYHESYFTNGIAERLPNGYYADKTQFSPNGIMFYLREDVDRKSTWQSQRLAWPADVTTQEWQDMMEAWSK